MKILIADDSRVMRQIVTRNREPNRLGANRQQQRVVA